MSDGDEESRQGEALNGLFPFRREEEPFIDVLIGSIRTELHALDPAELRQTANLLYALQRLPCATPDIFIDLSKSQHIGEDFFYVSIEITGDTFRLSKGGSVYTPGVSSDSHSETLFHLEGGGLRDGTANGFAEWLANFKAAGGVYEFNRDGWSDIDLTEPIDANTWERLDEYWERVRRNNDDD